MSDVEAAVAQGVGDYDLRGPDYETLLLGPVTGSIIDAARLVRDGHEGDAGWRNGFPNWALYRTAFAGDTHLAVNLEAWCIAFGQVHCEVRPRPASAAVGSCAGRDALCWLRTRKWGVNSDKAAAFLGIAPKTYRQIRNEIAVRLNASLQEYWMRLGIAMRQVALLERRQESSQSRGGLSDGRGFGHEISAHGDGNYRAMPRGSGC